jgi:hypothetical protein
MRLPNEEQQKNLRTLADYLLSGNLKAEFDMTAYADPKNYSHSTECGTVGCAIGHGPFAGIAKGEEEEWEDYVNRAFGTDQYEIFMYLFDSEWKYFDNTPQGSANRILAFLEQLENGTLTEEYLVDNTPFQIY